MPAGRHHGIGRRNTEFKHGRNQGRLATDQPAKTGHARRLGFRLQHLRPQPLAGRCFGPVEEPRSGFTMMRRPNIGLKKYPTMNDVAFAVGVHATTVSLALRSHPSIPLATRTRILNAVREIGYIRDPMLDAFNYHRCCMHTSKQSPSIAFVADANTSPFFGGLSYHPLVYDGVRAVADPQHLSLEVFILGTNGLTPSRLNTILTSRGITGILLSTFTQKTNR